MNLSDTEAAEVLFAINQMPFSKKQKIPKEVVDELLINYSKEFYSSLDNDKTFLKQNFSDEALEALNSIAADYLL